MRKLLIIFSLLAGKVFAQLPESDIYLARIEIKNNLIKFEKAENITNHKGYDNQPSFSKDGKLLYFSSETGDRSVWIKSYRLGSKKWEYIMAPQMSLYSPGETPDGKYVSAVIVERDSTQRIWSTSKDNHPQGDHFVHEGTDSVGYYAWLGKDSILYYKLTDPHSLRVLDLKTGEDNWLCDHPTRSFKQIDGRTIFYVINGEKENQIYFYDIRVKKATLFATDKRGNQDYVWLPGLGMLKSEESKLYRYSTETKVWVEVADFSASGIKKITRFAFSPDKKYIAVVSNQ